MAGAAAAMGDLFAPGFNRSDPASVAAQQNWQSRNFALTPDMIEQTRSPSTTVTSSLGLAGLSPLTRALSTTSRTTPGSVDPEALKIYAQGGKYDLNARRNAIAAQVQAQQPAPAASGGGGGGYDPYAAYRSAMASRGGGGGGGLTGLGGLGALRGGGGGGDPYAAFRASMASRAQPATGGGGGGDPHAGMHYDPSVGIGENPWKAGPGMSGGEELAAAQARQDADPTAQYFANKGPMSGSATETGWMNALQPWQGGQSGALTGTGINTSGFIGGGGAMHADTAYWGAGGAGAQKDASERWQQLARNRPDIYGALGGDANAAAAMAAGYGPGSNAAGVGPGAVSGYGGAGSIAGGGNVSGGYGTNSMGSNTSGDQLGYASTSPGSTFGAGATGYDNFNGYGVMGSFSPSSNYSGYSPSNPGYGNYGGDAYGYGPTSEGPSGFNTGYGGAFGGTQSGYGFQGDAPAAFGGGLGQFGFGTTANSTMGLSPYGGYATVGPATDAYGNSTYGAVPGVFGGDAFGQGLSAYGGFGFGPGSGSVSGDMGDEGDTGQGESL